MSQSKDISPKKERKTDRRSIYTRKVIMDSYIQLLKKEPKEKIKITELCKLADINRCTFYLHFKDILEVESAIEESLFNKFKKHLETQKPGTHNRLLLSSRFMDTMLHDDIYVTLMSSNHSPSFLSEFMDTFYFDELKAALPKSHHLTDRNQELLYAFIVGGVMAVEQNWIQNSNNIKQENLFLDKMVQMLLSINE